MSNRIPEEEVLSFFKERDDFLIFTHNSPDGDTVGSAMALVMGLRSLGKRAVAYNREGVPERLAFLPFGEYFTEEVTDTEGYTLVSVDVASPKMLSLPEAGYTFALSIDHHKVNTVSCERLYLRDDLIAAGEAVFEILRDLGVELTAELALPLYTAICSDSGGFRYQATRPETMRYAADLMGTGIDFAKICRLLFDSKSPSQIAAEKLGYQKLELHFGGRFALVAVTEEELRLAGATEEDTEVLNLIPRQIAGVQMSAVIKPKGNFVKCSFRSNEDIDVAALSQTQNGGGHYHAAGFSMENTSVEAVRALVLSMAEGAVL